MSLVRILSVHAGYACRQRGACCAAGWPVPVEPDCANDLERAVRVGRLKPRVASPPLEHPVDAPTLLARPDGLCTFFDQSGRAACRVHASLGHAALPLACRQFPRITVQDPRGVSVTLSHYCPTAAALLDADGTIGVLDSAPGFPSNGEYVGLDARDGLPPLLRPDMATDWESWWALERAGVSILAAQDDPVGRSIALLRGVVEEVRTWRPGVDRLIDRVTRAATNAAALPGAVSSETLVADVLAAVLPGLPRPLPTGTPAPSPHSRRGFLAAHAFANWTAHLGLDLRAWLRSIETADALLGAGYSVREADLLLRHLTDPFELARRWSEAVTSRP